MDSSSSSSHEQTMQVVVNTSGGKSITLKVQPSDTVANLLEFLQASTTTLPAGSQLVLAGKQLEPTATVGELQLTESSTLNLFTPSASEAADTPQQSATSSATTSGTSTPAKRKSNKPRCTKEGCKSLAQPIVGDCGFCEKRFCAKHRMLESHNCTGLQDARQADKDRNTAKLEHERTVTLRGL